MGKKILLADDSITIQKVIELTFSDEDFDVVTVGNGRLAIEKVQEVRPDVVLCDIIMPEKDGYEVCEFIKKSPGLQHVPVLLLTGAFEPFDQERAARVGSDGFLAKPFEPETLIAKVKDLLGRPASRPAGSAPPSRPTPAAGPAIPFAPPAARESEVTAPRPAMSSSPPLTVVPPRPSEPIPFPRAAPPPLAEPAKPSPPSAASAAPVSFIPEEPFEDLDPGSFVAEEEPASTVRVTAKGPGRSAADELLPMTPEESESLSVPDSSATVMFKAGAVQWQAPPAPAPPASPPLAASPPAPTPAPSPSPVAPSAPTAAAPPAFVPEPGVESAEFEEVIEEVEFGEAYAPGAPLWEPARPGDAEAPPPPGRTPERAAGTVDVAPPPASAPPAPSRPPSSRPPASAPPASAPPPAEPMPTVAMAPPWFSVGQDAAEPPPKAVPTTPAPAAPPPATAAPPAAAGEPAGARPPAESFADLATGAPSAPPRPPSEAAEVSVPVEMVEKIAQRVVAQVSEKVVREIAWDVIPDLAEALIKAEIERLKAELQRI